MASKATYKLHVTSVSAEGHPKNLQLHGLAECNTAEEIALAMGISRGKLRFLTLNSPASTITHYTRFKISKKTGEERSIVAPGPNLKSAQRWILDNILEKLEVHSAAHGFCKKRSTVTNAKPHVGADILVKIDLQNFFQSISYKRVKGLFSGLGYSETAANIFGLICTAFEIKEIEKEGQINYTASGDRHLPQGSPASPAISNLICRHLDSRIAIVAKNLGFCYTRYADDLTFSGCGEAARRISNLMKEIKLIIAAEGFSINRDKTKIMGRSVQQEVTGIVVNTQLNISKKTLKAFRATLYQIEQEGLSGKKWGNSTNLIASIAGFANYVSMVDPSKGAELQLRVARIKQKYEGK
ncbi:RNA-directed DNA polymerase [Oscillatoria nigro-viridis PCC 7112]|uniref:RNA-directed DNA polymerase n=1 Tax=Phormidium nigroviride PCC 7112 TaxID=179408 RepID=K9VLP5_9CYAN|nr:reverse transcriptase family protein [Oscillatoria nigro-viridis]AFZ08135.1 RNA-directed DNA polymerase [Oscillatoria nigro-viridis PCC 7112]